MNILIETVDGNLVNLNGKSIRKVKETEWEGGAPLFRLELVTDTELVYYVLCMSADERLIDECMHRLGYALSDMRVSTGRVVIIVRFSDYASALTGVDDVG